MVSKDDVNSQHSTLNIRRPTALVGCLLALICFCSAVARAGISVTASVDRSHIAFGESVSLTIKVEGTQRGAQASIPSVDGLSFNGPSTQSLSFDFNGQKSEQFIMVWQVTPNRTGQFKIPAAEVEVDGKKYSTEPIEITVENVTAQPELQERLYARVQFDRQPVFLGQTAPLNVVLFARADFPLYGLSGFQVEAEGLGYRHLNKVRSESRGINGVSFNVVTIEGVVTPTRTGKLAFGPAAIKCQKRVGEDWFGRVQTEDITVPVDPLDIEVLPLPEEGRPADFAGAIGQWNLAVTAKPTELAVGDPITFTIKISGTGNIDTVPAPKLGSLEGFKTYDPTTKTTKDDLNTSGQRVIQQVLIPKSTEVKELPDVRLTYFDPVAKAYKVAMQPPIQLMVKANSGGQTEIVSGGSRLRPEEKLGQDIVYLKGDLGPTAATIPFYATSTFWMLNIIPVLGLFGGIGWKWRRDKLRGDVAYARRSRAAKSARKLLASATSYDEVQHALQSYLGDRLNIPSGGITASIVDEQLVPRGVNGELAADTKACFEVCDTVRFAGGDADNGVTATREKVERLIDEFEKKQL